MESTSGSVSIEASISLPIYVIILVTFIYLLYMFSSSDEVSYVTSNLLLENFNEEYMLACGESEVLNLADSLMLINEITKSLKLQRVNSLDVSIKDDDEFILAKLNYNFIMPFKIFDNGIVQRTQIYKKRKFQKGMSLEDYNIVSKKIDAGFDVWSLTNYERAETISKLLGGTDSFNGNGIDKIENGKAVAIVSLDFRKTSYDNAQNVTNKVREDIEKLITFKKGYVGSEYVTENDYTKKVLELVIPDSEISPDLEKELIRIKQIASNAGLGLKITQIGGE